MFKTTLYAMFESFNEINDKLKVNKISEISIHQGQISMFFTSSNIVYLSDIEIINNVSPDVTITDITTYNDNLIASFRDTSKLDSSDIGKSPFNLFQKIIEVMAEHICTCPALEFVISDKYIKCFIDKPNALLKDIAKMDRLFDADGSLVISDQRAYILYTRPYGEDQIDI